MARSGVSSLALAVLCLVEITLAAPAPERYFGYDQSAMRVFRRGQTPPRTSSQSNSKDLECPYDIISQPGLYILPSGSQTCTWLFLSGPNAVVELEITQMESPCAPDARIEFFDGIALQMGVFPMETDHDQTLQDRVDLLCNTGSRVLIASQNVAMLTYQRAPDNGPFKVLFKHRPTQAPCNILGADSSGHFTISNYGKERNCSFAAIYPGYINVLHMTVGRETNEARLKCKNMNDMVQFLEGNSLELGKMNVEQRVCGRAGKSPSAAEGVVPASPADGLSGTQTSLRAPCTSGITIPLMCQLSVVRLVSSGLHDNSVAFTFSREINEKNECSVF